MLNTNLDKKNMLGSLESLGGQMKEVSEQSGELKLPASHKKVKNVALLGMGGSAIGMHLIKSVFADELKVPIEIINDYKLPASVGKNTLAIASSYSGGTEETLEAVMEAKKRKAKIVVISAGGKLAELAKKYKWPALIFTTKNNPCNQPRMGLGYSIVGQMVILQKAGLLGVETQNFASLRVMTRAIECFGKKFGVKEPEESNVVLQLAKKLRDKSVWFAGSEHLLGNAHIAANQMNENGKRFASYFALPELNHHLLEGMLFPESNKNNLAFVLLESGLYDKHVQKRYEITRSILEKNNITQLSYMCREKELILQACELLVFTAYISFYSAMLQGIDPTAIPVVDFFKEQLKK